MSVADAMSVLTAYYDLGKNPPSFNFVDFLLIAERRRLALGLAKIQVRIIPGSYDGFRCDKVPPYGSEARTRWLNNIVIPLAAMLPSCGEPAKMFDPAEPVSQHYFGRGEYLVGLHHNVKAAQENCYPLRADPALVSRWRHLGRFVTITMREVEWWPDRTTPLPLWLRIAANIRDAGYLVVFIRDGAKAEEKVEGFDTAPPEVSLCSDERAAMYAAALTNIFIPCGPLMLAWFMGAPALMFKPICGHTTASGWEGAGIKVGGQFANARPGQHFVWSGDDSDVVSATVISALRSRRANAGVPGFIERETAHG